MARRSSSSASEGSTLRLSSSTNTRTSTGVRCTVVQACNGELERVNSDARGSYLSYRHPYFHRQLELYTRDSQLFLNLNKLLWQALSTRYMYNVLYSVQPLLTIVRNRLLLCSKISRVYLHSSSTLYSRHTCPPLCTHTPVLIVRVLQKQGYRTNGLEQTYMYLNTRSKSVISLIPYAIACAEILLDILRRRTIFSTTRTTSVLSL